jgi:hypothetical protein
MKKSDITFITGAVFVSFTSFFYSLAICCKIPVPRYYPLEHVWKMAKIKGVPSQGWYGLQGFAFFAAGILALIIYLILKKYSSKKALNLAPATHKIISILTILVIVCSMGYIMCHEFGKFGVFEHFGL